MKHSRVSLNKPRRTHKRRVSAHKKPTKIKRPHKTKKTNRNLKSEPFIFPNYIGGNSVETDTNTVLDNVQPTQPNYSPLAIPVSEPVSGQSKDDDNALLKSEPANFQSEDNTIATPEILPEPVSDNTNTDMIPDEPNNEAKTTDIAISSSKRDSIDGDLTPYKNDPQFNGANVLDNTTTEEYNTDQPNHPSILVGSDDSLAFNHISNNEPETPSEILQNEENVEENHPESIITEQSSTEPEMPLIPKQPPQIEDLGTNMKTESIDPYIEETLEPISDKVETTSPILKPISKLTSSSNTSSQLDSVVNLFATLIADKIIAQLNTGTGSNKSPVDKMSEALQSLNAGSMQDQGGGGRKGSSGYSPRRTSNTKKRRHYLYNLRTEKIRRMYK